jgi:DNA-binding transcriptional MerR regulator
MLISEFARAAEMSVDTVRFYVRKGLLQPETGMKGGANPYQIFTPEHVEQARMIRMAQGLGFSLREISALAGRARYDFKRVLGESGGGGEKDRERGGSCELEFHG